MKTILKKLSAFMMALAISGTLFAQVPQKFNYQGIARDTKGNPMAQQRMTLKLTVLPTADATTGEYEEIQTVTTNEFGLYTLQIGNGTPISGEMKTVKWETGNKYIKVAIDPKGGSDFVDAGTTQLLSVPYAIYADKAGMAKTAGGDRTGAMNSAADHGVGDINYLTKFTAFNYIGKSQLYDNGTNIGIGTVSPLYKLHIQKSTGNSDILVRTLDTAAASSLRLRNSAGVELGINKFGPSASGTFMSLPRSNMAAVNNSTGPFVFNSGSDMVFGNSVGANQFPRLIISGATGNVGIGTLTPTVKLEVAGQVKIQGGAPGLGKVLTSDATGLATWQAPSSGSNIPVLITRDDFSHPTIRTWWLYDSTTSGSVFINTNGQLQMNTNFGQGTARLYSKYSKSVQDGKLIFTAGLFTYEDNNVAYGPLSRGLVNGTDRNNAIEFININGSTIQARTVLNGVATTTNFNVGASVAKDYSYSIIASTTKVEFFFNGSLIATHTTNIPTVPLNMYFDTSSWAGNVPHVIDDCSFEIVYP